MFAENYGSEAPLTHAEDWRYFERLVAAIHSAADRGARVRWNEEIKGRQFDVTIRFLQGLYEYLTVVECKNYKTPVPVSDVEAFVTKSTDVHAHHAVMASTSGFQSGAQEVARRHNVTLIHVGDSTEIDPSVFGAAWGGETPAFHLQRIELEYQDGEKKLLPEDSNVLTYYAQQVKIKSESEEQSLEEFIEPHMEPLRQSTLGAYNDHSISCDASAHVTGPDDGEVPLKPLAYIHIRAGVTMARILTGSRMFEPNLLVPDVTVRNLATGEEKNFRRDSLKLGFNTTFAEGAFYVQPPHDLYFYCDEIKGTVAHLYLVESFQLGKLIQAEIMVETQYADHYIPVSDEEVVKRLRRRLEKLRGKGRSACS